MTEIEQKALALLNEVTPYECVNTSDACHNHLIQALCRAIEAHDAFRQEVSDAVEKFKAAGTWDNWDDVASFIIAKPDPLVEVINDADDMVRKPDAPSYAEAIRAALAARGLKIVEVSHE